MLAVDSVSRDCHMTSLPQQIGVRKAFKNIFQEEKILEEAKKELQNCCSKVAKLQRQVSEANADKIKSICMDVKNLVVSSIASEYASFACEGFLPLVFEGYALSIVRDHVIQQKWQSLTADSCNITY